MRMLLAAGALALVCPGCPSPDFPLTDSMTDGPPITDPMLSETVPQVDDGMVDEGPGDASPQPTSTCGACHAGIERAHPGDLACVECHGGDGAAESKEAAHVTLPQPAVDIRRLTTDELDALDPAVIQWVNPGDLRVAHKGCGSESTSAGGTGCHQDIVETSRRSVMQTYTGHYNLPRYLANMQDRPAVYGVVSVEDPDYQPDVALSVPSIVPLRSPPGDDGSLANVVDKYLPQQCPWCHTASFGRNNAKRDYRSSGCTACHMLYQDTGFSESADRQRQFGAPHPKEHTLTTAIPTDQCEHCHYQGARIGLAYQGIREGGHAEPPIYVPEADCVARSRRPPSRCGVCCATDAGLEVIPASRCNDDASRSMARCADPAAVCCKTDDATATQTLEACTTTGGEVVATPLCQGETCCKADVYRVILDDAIHTHGPGFYYLDEDRRNNRDETPPDIHFEKGLHCADCHTSVEVHGDGRIYSTAKGQLDILCTDCHGTVRAPIQADADGKFRTERRGTVITNLARADDGQIYLRGRISGRDHPVSQIQALLQRPDKEYMRLAMGVDEDTGFSHTDTMECWTCHTSWRLTCFGCHVKQDYSSDKVGKDFQTGEIVAGRVSGARQDWAIDFQVLGTNRRGMIDTMCASMQVFLTNIDADGNRTLDAAPRTTETGKVGFGWMPNQQHTIRSQAKPCTQCHPDAAGHNLAEVRAVYGFGAPWRGFNYTDGAGQTHDMTQMRAADGTPLTDFPHEGSGPVPMDVVERATALGVLSGGN